MVLSNYHLNFAQTDFFELLRIKNNGQCVCWKFCPLLMNMLLELDWNHVLTYWRWIFFRESSLRLNIFKLLMVIIWKQTYFWMLVSEEKVSPFLTLFPFCIYKVSFNFVKILSIKHLIMCREFESYHGIIFVFIF